MLQQKNPEYKFRKNPESNQWYFLVYLCNHDPNELQSKIITLESPPARGTPAITQERCMMHRIDDLRPKKRKKKHHNMFSAIVTTSITSPTQDIREKILNEAKKLVDEFIAKPSSSKPLL